MDLLKLLVWAELQSAEEDAMSLLKKVSLNYCLSNFISARNDHETEEW
jgi:hypothetical protein